MESNKFVFGASFGICWIPREDWGTLGKTRGITTTPPLRILRVLRWIDSWDHFLTMKHVLCGGRQRAAGTTNPGTPQKLVVVVLGR